MTHHCFDNSALVKNYPRGNKELQQVFAKFSVQDTIDWFRQQGVILKAEADGRMFPYSDSSQTIIDCFMNLARQLGISIKTGCEVQAIRKHDNGFTLKTSEGEMNCQAVICALGGHNKSGAYQVIKNLGHTIDEPVPSLFTFNLPNEPIKKELQGVSVQNAEIKIASSKLHYSGPVLITHWGLSGPAVLKLSAFAAKDFFELNYYSDIFVNWAYPLQRAEVDAELKQLQSEKRRALPWSQAGFGLPKRLWEFLCRGAGIDNTKPWAELGNKQINKLAEQLCHNKFSMQGKTTFKEEFVTCGGVNLKEVDFKTMQSKLVPGLFFCGEVLNIDGITGGFNFQNAWSTAWICSRNI